MCNLRGVKQEESLQVCEKGVEKQGEGWMAQDWEASNSDPLPLLPHLPPDLKRKKKKKRKRETQ